jgi:hypothetical protein
MNTYLYCVCKNSVVALQTVKLMIKSVSKNLVLKKNSCSSKTFLTNLKRERRFPNDATNASLPGSLPPGGATRTSLTAPVPSGKGMTVLSDGDSKLICIKKQNNFFIYQFNEFNRGDALSKMGK